MKKKTGYPSIDCNHEDKAKFFEKHPILPNTSLYKMYKLANIGNKANINCLDLNVTIPELNKHIDELTRSLLEIGSKPGDILTVCASNYIQCIALFFAANRLGVGVSFLNAKSSPYSINHYIKKFNSKICMCYGLTNEQIQLAIDGSNIEVAVNMTEENLRTLWNPLNVSSSIGYNNIISYNDFTALSGYYKERIVESSDKNNEALYLFTSGTTGAPKIPILTNENVIAASMYMKNSAHTTIKNDGTSLVTVSFNYPFGFAVSTLMSLFSRKSLILAPDLTLANLHKYIEKKPNVIFGIPPIYDAMKNDPIINAMDLSFIDIAISGGDYFSVENNIDTTKFLKEHGSKAHICNGSGQAETTSAGTNAVSKPYNPNTVGYVLAGSKMKAIDPETRKEVKYGEKGLLCTYGKHVFKGYYGDEEATKKCFETDEMGRKWYVSDTVGSLNLDGSEEILGRERRFFITCYDSTFKCYCDYIQRFINTFPEVKECAIVKQRHSSRGEVAKAYIVLKDDIDPTNETKDLIYARCINTIIRKQTNHGEELEELKPYEVPLSFDFLDALPLTDAFKIDYTLLEKRAEDEYSRGVKVLKLK